VGCNRNCLGVGWDGCGASRGRHPNLLLELVGPLSARLEAGRGTVAHRTVIQIRSEFVERPPFPIAERQAITSQVRAWAPEVVSRKPRPVTIPARVRLTGPLRRPDHRHSSAPSRTVITPCRPPSSCRKHTWTACSAIGPSASRCHSPDYPGSIPLCWTPPYRPSDAASGDRAAKKVLWHICGTQE